MLVEARIAGRVTIMFLVTFMKEVFGGGLVGWMVWRSGRGRVFERGGFCGCGRFDFLEDSGGGYGND